MLVVLSRITHMKPYPTDLRDQKTITTLLKYLRERKDLKETATILLTKIVK